MTLRSLITMGAIDASGRSTSYITKRPSRKVRGR